jgi:hypothetical protein
MAIAIGAVQHVSAVDATQNQDHTHHWRQIRII